LLFELWSERPNVLAKKRLVLLGKGSVKDGMENLGQNTGLPTDSEPLDTMMRLNLGHLGVRDTNSRATLLTLPSRRRA
jgi:hypothetical protein